MSCDRPLNTWQEIAAYLKISVRRVQRMKRDNPDFPIWYFGNARTTEQAIVTWIRRKALGE